MQKPSIEVALERVKDLHAFNDIHAVSCGDVGRVVLTFPNHTVSFRVMVTQVEIELFPAADAELPSIVQFYQLAYAGGAV